MLFSNEFVFRTFHFSSPHYTDNRKGSPANFLACMLRGSARIVSEKTTLQLAAGDVFYIPKNLPYQSYWTPDSEGSAAFLSFGFQHLYTCENTQSPLQVVPCPQSVKDKILCIPTNEKQVTCESLSIFYGVMAQVFPLMQDAFGTREAALVERIRLCICGNPLLSIAEIAQKCSISEPYLYALFKKALYTTPNAYRLQVLCERAEELLLTTDQKIEDIALSLGFSSGSYFRKVFKSHTHCTPREVRKKRGF